jgi:signal transduction histidine kinase
LSWPGESFFIQDEAGTLRIAPADPSMMPKPGDLVDTGGFVANAIGTSTILENALWRRIGSTNIPKARLAHVADLLSDRPNGQSVAVEGALISMAAHESGTMALLEEEGRIIRVFCREKISSDHLRSWVRVTGVLSTRPGLKNSVEPCLWVNSEKDVPILKKALAAADSGGARYLPAACAAAVAASLALAGLLWAARKNAAVASAALQTNAEDLHQLQKEVAQLREGRERLGRDLHDHIIQSIYAVGLNLEDSRQNLIDPAKTEERLKTALAEINEVIRELRNVILGLETSTIQPQEFRTALKSLALTLGHANSTRVRLNIDQDALDKLSPAQATELVHIAREAISNSIRHGQAETTTLSLHRYQDWVRFAVEDDGKGFDGEQRETKGFGLRNMAKRAEGLGAKFTISAQEGLGTRIVLDIPKQKQHFSNSEPRSIANR